MNTPNDSHPIGSGPHKVICLHGWFGHACGWGPMADYLDTDAFSYAFMDQRGYGRKKGSGGPYTIAQIAQDALALADDLGWKQFALIGHSMAGSAIQHVLADAPDRVQALVGITPVPASGVPFDDESWKFFSGAGKEPATRRAILDLTTGNRLPGKWLDAMTQASFENSDAEAVDAYLTAWAKTSFVDRIQGKTQPVLVLAGEHDPALGEATCKATWMQHYPHAKLQVIANAGHYPMDETPLALIAAFEAFLREALPG